MMPRPTRAGMQRAYDLGRRMARKEYRLCPRLAEAAEYRSFDEFRLAHRHALELSCAFQLWDEQLRSLTDADGRRLGFDLDDSAQWDLFYQYVAVPMRVAFWIGWENVYGLDRLYEQTLANAPAKPDDAQVQVLHCFMKGLNDEVAGEKETWEAITSKLFEEGEHENQEDFWELPDAAAIATKAGV